MPRIPITSIPNIPQGTGPVLQSGPQGVSDIRQAERSLLTPTIPVNAFSGQANGLAFLGERGIKAGEVLNHWGAKKLELQDEISKAQADEFVAAAMSKHAASIVGKPEDQWTADIPKYQDEALKQIDGLAMSDEQRQLLTAKIGTQFATYTGDTNIRATKSGLEKGVNLLSDQMKQAIQNGQYDVAYEKAAGLKKFGFTDDQIKVENDKIYQQQRHSGIVQAINMNPKAIMDDLGEAKKTGVSKAFGDMTPEEIDRYDGFARGQWHQTQSDAREKLMGEVDGGVYTTVDAAMKDYGTILDAKEVKSIVSDVADSKGPLDMERRNSVRTLAYSYDPAKDPTGAERSKIEQQISTAGIPRTEQRELFGVVKRLNTQGMTPNDRVRSDIYKRIDDLANNQVFGTFKDKKGKEDAKLRQGVFDKVSDLKDQFDAWQKDHPNATRVEADAHFYDLVRPLGITSAAEQLSATPRHSFNSSDLFFNGLSAPYRPANVSMPSPVEIPDPLAVKKKLAK